jgi:uncharacterized protein YvpB
MKAALCKLVSGCSLAVLAACSGVTQDIPEPTQKTYEQKTTMEVPQKPEPTSTPAPNPVPEAPAPAPVPEPTPADMPDAPPPANDKVMLDVPLIKQNPELKFGCEVTSLAMVLKHAGVDADKLKLARELAKDNDPMKKETGDIKSWGNPEHGFVGDITGKSAGFAVYVGPLEQLMSIYLPDRTEDLTRKSFDEVLSHLKGGKPVILWTTGDYKAPDRWESWKHGHERINAPLDLHAVVLVGCDSDQIYINDPLSGKRAHPVKKELFMQSWVALGQQALSYK